MKNNQPNKLLIGITILLIGLSIVGCQEVSSAENQVCFDKHCFNVEIVSSGLAKQRGLQFRTSLDQNAGMLFAFAEEKKHAFWMKDTVIPLDMIWLDYSHRVVHIISQVPPCTSEPCPVYTPSKNAMFVLEVNAGTADKIGLHENDWADFKFQK